MTKHQTISVLPVQDRVRGCLIGGAAGDALGYPVEFFSEHTLWARYGDDGIQEYELDPVRDKALISDDTQMTLFTANGILYGETRMATRGIGSAPHCYVSRSYQDWLFTQQASFSERSTAGRHLLAAGDPGTVPPQSARQHLPVCAHATKKERGRPAEQLHRPPAKPQQRLRWHHARRSAGTERI